MICDNESVDYWPNYFKNNTKVDIFEIIDHAISIAARDNPRELRMQRGRILAKVYPEQRKVDRVDGGVNKSMEEKKIDKVTKTIMEFDGIDVSIDQLSSNNQTKNLDSNGVSKSEDDDELIRLKYESTKRKVQTAYRQAAKKQHKVQTLELHELSKKNLRQASLHVTHKYFKPPSFVRRW